MPQEETRYAFGRENPLRLAWTHVVVVKVQAPQRPQTAQSTRTYELQPVFAEVKALYPGHVLKEIVCRLLKNSTRNLTDGGSLEM